MKNAGILLPITALPSEYGIGCFSESAYEFIDWLKDAGQTYWQILPIGPTSYGDSPYQSPSAFAGNPYFISLKELIKEGLLTQEECDSADFGKTEDDIDYSKMYENRYPLLRRAFERSNTDNDTEYAEFINSNSHWLPDYALFMAIKDSMGGAEWSAWPEDIRLRKSEAMDEYCEKLKDDIKLWQFIQYKFYSQWNKLKKYANRKGISIIGDIPIYVSMDSADVWANPELFQLDDTCTPTFVAGCPPDGFSALGQLWGNPLYKWEAHKNDGYSWWIMRLKHCFDLFDTVRIDHFRGFDEYYSIPYGREDAVIGSWEKGPGIELFNAVKNALGEQSIIAEDLGYITDSVRKLLKDSGFAGIKVLEFAFDSRDTGYHNDYLPHNYPENCVAYTGTHDNQTLVSWFKEITFDEKNKVREYLYDFYTPDSKLFMPLISLIMQSVAKTCIVPIQDYMGCDDRARINKPSTLGTNWRWRLKKSDLSKKLQIDVLGMTKRYGRTSE